MYNSNFYNPYLQRLQEYQQQYPQYVQPQVQQQHHQGIQTLQVSNIDEANAYRVDPMGIPTLFYNAGKDEIYLKRTNQTGLTDFFIFRHVQEPTNTMKDKKDANPYEKDFKALNDKIDGLYSILAPQPKQKEAKNDK